MDPATLKYTKTHEWAFVEGDVVTIGLTDFAVNLLTDLVFIDLPTVGAQFGPGDSFGEVESVKAVSDLYCPAVGEVLEVNTALADDLDALSQDPFGRGWLVKLRLDTSDASGLEDLMDRSAYESHCASEVH